MAKEAFIKDAVIIDSLLIAEFDDGKFETIGHDYKNNIDPLDIIGLTLSQAWSYYFKRYNS